MTLCGECWGVIDQDEGHCRTCVDMTEEQKRSCRVSYVVNHGFVPDSYVDRNQMNQPEVIEALRLAIKRLDKQ